MNKPAIAAALAAALSTTTAQAQYLSCDTFMQRLRDAGRALTFPLPPVKIERNPYETDHDAFWISYPYADYEREGSLTCSNRHLDDYQMDIDNYDVRRRYRILSADWLRNIHIVAAALYAYTGWPARQTIALANKLVDKQPHDISPGSLVEEELPNEGAVSVGYVGVLVSGKCGPAVYPTLCGTPPDKPK